MGEFAYTFIFAADYDASIFNASPYANPALESQVQSAVGLQKLFLARFPLVNAISSQLKDGNNTYLFKVQLNRT